MANPLIRKLGHLDTLSRAEKRVLEDAIARVREFEADKDIVRKRERPSVSHFLLEGWACRYNVLDGGRRQIVAIHIPGDFLDLYGFPLKRMDHSIATLTPCKVAVVSHATLTRVTKHHLHLAQLLWVNTLIDASIAREWLVGLGRRSARERVAHLLCELYTRLKAVALARDYSFRVPVTQAELADALGLSTIHTNRVLQHLRREGLITWRGDSVVIKDWDRLREVAVFDPTFLHLKREPR